MLLAVSEDIYPIGAMQRANSLCHFGIKAYKELIAP